MKVLFLIFVLSVLIPLSSCLFFGRTRVIEEDIKKIFHNYRISLLQSSCRSNRDCPRLTSSGGRCVDRNNGLCGLASEYQGSNCFKYFSCINNFLDIFRRNKENCSYKTCGQCVNDVDCAGDSYCSGFFCIQRYTPPSTTPNYGYIPPYVTPSPVNYNQIYSQYHYQG